MSLARPFMTSTALLILLAIGVTPAQSAGFSKAIGPYGGYGQQPDQFFFGGRAEFGRFGPAVFSPGIDVGFGDNTTVTTINVDLKWYLLPLPDTGLYFYGAAGPTLVAAGGSEVGISLAAGMHVPMHGSNRYNLEVRFGFGDIPDLRILAAVMFGFR